MLLEKDFLRKIICYEIKYIVQHGNYLQHLFDNIFIGWYNIFWSLIPIVLLNFGVIRNIISVSMGTYKNNIHHLIKMQTEAV